MRGPCCNNMMCIQLHFCFTLVFSHHAFAPPPREQSGGAAGHNGDPFCIFVFSGALVAIMGVQLGVLFTMHSCATPCTATHYHSFIWGVGIGFTIILLFCMYAQPSKEGAKYLMKDQSLFSAYFIAKAMLPFCASFGRAF